MLSIFIFSEEHRGQYKLCHMVQQHQQNQLHFEGLWCFSYGCCCKDDVNSKTWMPHTLIFITATQKIYTSAHFQGKWSRFVSKFTIWTNVKYVWKLRCQTSVSPGWIIHIDDIIGIKQPKEARLSLPPPLSIHFTHPANNPLVPLHLILSPPYSLESPTKFNFILEAWTVFCQMTDWGQPGGESIGHGLSTEMHSSPDQGGHLVLNYLFRVLFVQKKKQSQPVVSCICALLKRTLHKKVQALIRCPCSIKTLSKSITGFNK